MQARSLASIVALAVMLTAALSAATGVGPSHFPWEPAAAERYHGVLIEGGEDSVDCMVIPCLVHGVFPPICETAIVDLEIRLTAYKLEGDVVKVRATDGGVLKEAIASEGLPGVAMLQVTQAYSNCHEVWVSAPSARAAVAYVLEIRLS